LGRSRSDPEKEREQPGQGNRQGTRYPAFHRPRPGESLKSKGKGQMHQSPAQSQAPVTLPSPVSSQSRSTWQGTEPSSPPPRTTDPMGGSVKAIPSARRHASCLPADRGGAFRLEQILTTKGLASADRNNKATLPLTAPSRAIKSSAKDLSLRIVKLSSDGEDPELFRKGSRCRPAAIQGQRPIRMRLRCAEVGIIAF
jgi:hypothetical protein